MIAYSQAALLEFMDADMIVLLEYHQWVIAKAIEGTYDAKKVAALVQADYHMRIRWMLSWRTKEFKTLTEVMRHHWPQRILVQ